MQIPAVIDVPIFGDSAFSSYKPAKPVTKKFKCPHFGCQRSFAKSDHLRTHVRTHTGERPFRCTHESCHKEFSDLANLKRHMRVHTGERPFTCPEPGCGKQFSVSSNLKQHMRVHTGERPYACPVCGKAFGHVSSRRKHMNIHEGSTMKMMVDLPRVRWVRDSPYGRRPSSSGSESSLESPTSLLPPNTTTAHLQQTSPLLAAHRGGREVTRPRPCYPRSPTRDAVALTGARVAVVHASRLNMTADLGQYVTVMMDLCYKVACVGLFVCSQQQRMQARGRQVPVRTIQ